MDLIMVIWLALIVLFIIIEALTLALTSIWFALGSIVALISYSCGAEIHTQIIMFILSSICVMVLARPVIKKNLNAKRISTNSDRLIGGTGIVREKIDNFNSKGVVFIEHKDWTARSFNQQLIDVGTEVEVLKIEGVKLIVKPKSTVISEG